MSTPLTILSPARRKVFDSIPKLSKDYSVGYSALDKKTRRITSGMKSDVNKVGFMVQRTYFQAKGRFFTNDKFKPEHKKLAEKSLGISRAVDISKYNSKTAAAHREKILKLYDWTAFRPKHRRELEKQAQSLVDKQKNKEDVLFALLDYCWLNKIEIPSYNCFSEVVTKAYLIFEENILRKVSKAITPLQQKKLLDILHNPSIVSKFSELKKINQATTQRKLNYSVEILKYFKDIFIETKALRNELQLTAEAVQYFSDEITKSTLPQIKKIKDPHKQCLLLLGFTQHQFFLRQDYAMDAFLKVIKQTLNSAKKHDRDKKESDQKILQEASRSLVNAAKNEDAILRQILSITDSAIPLAEQREKTRNLISAYFEAKDPEFGEYIEKIETNLKNYDFKLDLNLFIFSKSNSMQKTLSPLIKALAFDEGQSNTKIITAINHFQSKEYKFDESVPKSFLKDKMSDLVFSEDLGITQPTESRYKAFLFLEIYRLIRTKRLYLSNSYRYAPIHTYLISKSLWTENKLAYLKAAGLECFIDGEKILEILGKDLTDSYIKTNEKYQNNENPFLYENKHGNWSLRDSKPDFSVSKYIPGLLKDANPILLYELLSEMEHYTKFSDKLKHYKVKNTSTTKNSKEIIATLMSLGTNAGHTEMGKAARGVTEKQMRDTEKLWFSNQGLKNANECIVKFIQRMKLPTIYTDSDDTLRTSSDGKKIIVAVNSLLANYSYKYFGKEKGIVMNSFVDHKQSFFHVNVMSSSDREAPHMLDGLINTNENLFSDMDPEEMERYVNKKEPTQKLHEHMTDTHGHTHAVSAAMHFMNVSFVPRLKKANEYTMYAYEEKSMKNKSKQLVAPSSKIKRNLILDNWDDMLRLMATIKLKHISASFIFKTLSAGAADSQIYKAMKEFGRLLTSKSILSYIDNEDFRRSITKQLNIVELGQALSGAIFSQRSGRLYVGLTDEIQKVVLCKTIIKNAIVAWNYLFLSDFYNGAENKERRSILQMMSTGSVLAWKHINMMGIMNFDHAPPNSFSSTLKQMTNIRLVKFRDFEE